MERRGDLLGELSEVSSRLFEVINSMMEVDAYAATGNGVMAMWAMNHVAEDIAHADELHASLYKLANEMDASNRADLEELLGASEASLHMIARLSAMLAERAREQQARDRAMRARWSWRARSWLQCRTRVVGRWLAVIRVRRSAN